VRVVAEPDADVALVRDEGIVTKPPPLSRLAVALDVSPHGAAVAAGVTSDGRDRPTLPDHCHDFHVFLL
jgi:hypothetical protein